MRKLLRMASTTNYYHRSALSPDVLLGITIDRKLKIPKSVVVIPMEAHDTSPAEALGRLACSVSDNAHTAQFVYDYLSRRWKDDIKASWPTKAELIAEVKALVYEQTPVIPLAACG